MFDEIDDTDETPSAKPDTPELDPEAVLVRLHAALSDLDHAVYAAVRALEDAFSRPPSTEPARGLPMKEMASLGEHLRQVHKKSAIDETRQSIMDIAAELPVEATEDLVEEAPDGGGTSSIGVAPSGPLRVE